jgi:hypothetical protein
VTADNSDVTNKVNDSTSKLNTWAASEGTADVKADKSNADSTLGTAENRLRTWGGSSGTAKVNAQDNASSKINSVIDLLNSVPASVTTTLTTNLVTNYITTGTPGGVGFGGVAGYANGGVVAELAEWGPELVHYPSGGMGLAVNRGMYNLPVGSYVDTAPSTTAKLSSFGGVTLNMTINGNVGIDNIAEEVTRRIVPAIQQAANQHLRSYGL